METDSIKSKSSKEQVTIFPRSFKDLLLFAVAVSLLFHIIFICNTCIQKIKSLCTKKCLTWQPITGNIL